MEEIFGGVGWVYDIDFGDGFTVYTYIQTHHDIY